jgi:oligopeptide transport system substrate-binding protein
VAVLALMLVGCGRPTPPAGILRVGIGAEPSTLDPALATGIAENRVLSAIYEGLVMPDGVGGILPGVAQSWEKSEDGLTYTFKLREASWSDGAPITARDCAASWRRALSPSWRLPTRRLRMQSRELRTSGRESADGMMSGLRHPMRKLWW